MSLKIASHSKSNVTPINVIKNGISLEMECHSKWTVTQNGIPEKRELHSKWNISPNEMSLKM